MSKATIGVIAAASAAAGAVCTAFFYSSSTKKMQVASQIPITNQPPTSASHELRNTNAPSDKLVDPSGFFKYGFPGPVNDIATRDSLVSSFDRRTRNPSWAVEHITAESLKIKGGDRKNSDFKEDENVPEIFRAKLQDYYRSGYDRGHQVPAADAKFSQTAMDDTFYLTNMCPQVGQGFNRDYWAHFEEFCRNLTSKYPSVRIATGPLYLPKLYPDGKYRTSYEVIGNPPNVAVPTHFYKVIVAEDGTTGGNVAVGAFVLPNAPISNKTKLFEFVVPIEIVERASGLEFLSELPQNRKKELCKEVQCSITVREFNDSRKSLPGRRVS